MAEKVYLTLKGQVQGTIYGGATEKGRERSIVVIAMDHDIISPRDAASGLPTGKRLHKPLTITKQIDRATPLLHNAMANNENLTVFTLNFFHTDAQGIEKNYFRIELANSNISEIVTKLDNVTQPGAANSVPHELVSFVYQKVTWTYLEGSTTTGSDDWRQTNTGQATLPPATNLLR